MKSDHAGRYVLRQLSISSMLAAALSLGLNGPLLAGETYTADAESLAAHEAAPAWFRDAKFGIYFHWGPYSVPAYGGEWYPRWMHFPDLEIRGANNNDIPNANFYQHHIENYGHPSEFGYHDFVPMFTAEHFDADEWADLFKASGAQFAGPVGEHHDGFAMWDSEATPWNAADRGPKRDIAGEMAVALRERGLKFAISFHHARNLQRYKGIPMEEALQDPKARKNPRRAYAASHYPWVEGMPPTSDDPELQKLYGNLPEDEWLETMWLGKLKEVIDQYRPDLIWFDSWLDRIPEDVRYRFAAYYLNAAENWGEDVVITRKQQDLPLSFTVVDYEKGRASQMSDKPFLTDDTISLGSWSYTETMQVKKLDRVLHDFIDLVSKNGQLLLNISPRADGTIPEDQRAVLTGMGDWLKINGEAIYGTRPWVVFGEGPARLTRGGHFVEALEYSARDIRFTTRDGAIYLIALGVPENGMISVQSMSSNLRLLDSAIEKVELLGSQQAVEWKRDESGLHISLAGEAPSPIANVWKVTTATE